MLTSVLFGEFTQASAAKWTAVVGLGILLPASFAYRYSRSRRGPRDVVSEAEVVKVARKSARCPGCNALVLPADAGECLACGRLVKPMESVLIVAAFLAIMVGSILWGIYR